MSKKFTVPFSGFIEDPGNQDYQVRYRLVSDDRNRISAWSPIFSVNPNFSIAPPSNLPGGEPFIRVGGTATHVTATWYPAEIKTGPEYGYSFIDYLPFYDVWYRFFDGVGKGTWIYHGRVTDNFVSILRPTQIQYATPPINTFSIEVYRPTKSLIRMDTQDFDQNAGDSGLDYFSWSWWPSGWQTGDLVMYKPLPTHSVATGLSDNTFYYIRLLNNGTPNDSFALYATYADAMADTARVGITLSAGFGMLYKAPLDAYYYYKLATEYNVALP